MNLKVKICGITNLNDAMAAVEAGADALGFVFYQQSPRFVAPTTAARLIRALPPFIAKVGVFVDAPETVVRGVAEVCGLDTLQFHGAETPEFCQRFSSLKVVKAFRVKDAGSLAPMDAYDTDGWLLDAYVPEAHGGTGVTFNWSFAREAKIAGYPIILAGGLCAENVAQAVHEVWPYGVDVSSGVESAPGKKDAQMMREFIEVVRGIESERY